eukprot:GHVT01020951.1.p1 GENE.GHVT01020951.1~~GHVT01020951.1.p1  ORF type:complete len:100 (+),score=2.46 GHVT01020951.1:1115-1414(+)
MIIIRKSLLLLLATSFALTTAWPADFFLSVSTPRTTVTHVEPVKASSFVENGYAGLLAAQPTVRISQSLSIRCKSVFNPLKIGTHLRFLRQRIVNGRCH